MEDDLKRLSVGGKDDKVSQASVEGLGGLVGTLLQLYHVTKEVSKRTRYAIFSPHSHQ